MLQRLTGIMEDAGFHLVLRNEEIEPQKPWIARAFFPSMRGRDYNEHTSSDQRPGCPGHSSHCPGTSTWNGSPDHANGFGSLVAR